MKEQENDHDQPAARRDAILHRSREGAAYLAEIYHRNTGFIRGHLAALTKGIVPAGQVRACYPQIEVRSTSYSIAGTRAPCPMASCTHRDCTEPR